MAEPVIEVRGLEKTYRMGDLDVRALRGVDLEVQRGEFLAIMGASGSGKSTLMNVLGCLDRATSGACYLEGVDVTRLDEPALAQIRSRRIGFVFQSFNLLKRTSARENVALPLFYAGDISDADARADAALRALGLAGREDSHPSQLSGGEQQRVAIARALINDPAILLADEPTGNLDSANKREIMETLRALNREKGITVVLVTHEPEMAAYADRVISMRDGRIAEDSRASVARAVPPPAAPVSPAPAPAPAHDPRDDWQRALSLLRMAFGVARRAIARNKLRSALTMLGMFIGVAALIAMVAVGQGADRAVRAQLESLGTNLLVVMPGASFAGGVRGGWGSASTLTVADAHAIAKEPTVADVAYSLQQFAQVQYGNRNWNTNVSGISPRYLAIRKWPIAAGRALRDDDMERAGRVCLIGQTVYRNLFGASENPVGAVILIKGVALEVVGLLSARGQSGGGRDQDDTVLLPFSTAESKVLGVAAPAQPQAPANPLYAAPPNPFGVSPKITGYVNQIFVQAHSTEAVPEALAQIRARLTQRHRIGAGQLPDFDVRNLSDVVQAREGSSRILRYLLAAVASISLLVGGIGIMNILLVSVTERTREIGIRIAIGARRVHVLMQFLVEAVLLSGIGGLAGVLAGIAISAAISWAAGWPTMLSWPAIAGAFVFSAAVGVFFGYYPARRAASLDPIEALRYE